MVRRPSTASDIKTRAVGERGQNQGLFSDPSKGAAFEKAPTRQETESLKRGSTYREADS